MATFLKKYFIRIILLTILILLTAFIFLIIGARIDVHPPELDKREVESIIKKYIMNNPEVIIKSLEKMQERKIKEMKEKVNTLIKGKKTEIESTTNTPFFGNDKGDIVIVMFYDYNCGYCKKANIVLSELIASDPGVKVILKPMPILGESSEYIAKVALAVNNIKPEKFKAFHDDIMSSTTLTKESLIDIAEKHGLEYSAIEDEMDRPEVRDAIQKIRELALEIEINGAPAFIINGEHYSGLLELPKLQEIIKNLRNKSS